MNLLRIFKNSLRLPNKQALFSLNRENMRDTMVYILILIFILCLPDAVRIIYNFMTGESSVPTDVFIVQFTVLYPLMIIFLMVAGVSLHACTAYVIRSLSKRKLAYQQLWKMTSYALTIPILLLITFRMLTIEQTWINLIPFIVSHLLLYKMITVFPKRG
ncbi:DUF1189 family protein [Alkalibacillus aidingensis]|uniref:DUF1189 family protein n=1 Tax=Alkalibacillus aidingensis TaxID=2747607 RepID=UPI001661676A|nr:DUF1189 family protein [Alkalibacillus aidingensis]